MDALEEVAVDRAILAPMLEAEARLEEELGEQGLWDAEG
jgi:hypothetical protein